MPTFTRILLAVLALAAIAATGATATSSMAKPALTIRSSNWGRIVFDGSGRGLYAFTRDKVGGRSTCYGDCADAWPPYVVRGKLTGVTGIRKTLLGTVRRTDGSRQLTYAGRPLYYYRGDTGPGVVTCQNVSEYGGLWLVQRPSGKLVR